MHTTTVTVPTLPHGDLSLMVEMHHLHPLLLLLLLHCLLQSVLSFAPLSLFGSPYLWTSIMFRTHPRAGLANRQRYRAVFGERGERLIEVLSRGHPPRRKRKGTRPRAPLDPSQYKKVRVSLSYQLSQDVTMHRNGFLSNYFQVVNYGNPVNPGQTRRLSKYWKTKSNSDESYLFRIFKKLFSIFGMK